jgi:hypothetical protein
MGALHQQRIAPARGDGEAHAATFDSRDLGRRLDRYAGRRRRQVADISMVPTEASRSGVSRQRCAAVSRNR